MLRKKYANDCIELITWITKFVDLSSASNRHYDNDSGTFKIVTVKNVAIFNVFFEILKYFLDSDDDENWFPNEASSMLNSFQFEQRKLLSSLLLQQDFTEMDDTVVMEVARLIHSLNDSLQLSRLALDNAFQAKLLEQCVHFGEKGDLFSRHFFQGHFFFQGKVCFKKYAAYKQRKTHFQKNRPKVVAYRRLPSVYVFEL